jgi:hypothetical protein
MEQSRIEAIQAKCGKGTLHGVLILAINYVIKLITYRMPFNQLTEELINTLTLQDRLPLLPETIFYVGMIILYISTLLFGWLLVSMSGLTYLVTLIWKVLTFFKAISPLFIRSGGRDTEDARSILNRGKANLSTLINSATTTIATLLGITGLLVGVFMGLSLLANK